LQYCGLNENKCINTQKRNAEHSIKDTILFMPASLTSQSLLYKKIERV
jgi:hypothetical protein